MTKHLTEIRSVNRVMNLLGTDPEIADMFDTTARAVNNWRNQSFIPAKAAFRVQLELNAKGYYAIPEVLGQIGCDKRRITWTK